MSERERALRTGLVAGDLVAVSAALVGSHALLRAMGAIGPRAAENLAAVAPVALAVWLAAFAVNRMYALDDLFEGHMEYARVAQACTVAVLAMGTLAFWMRDWRPYMVREWILLAWIGSIAAVGLFRFGTRRLVRALRRRRMLTTTILIAGVCEESLALARQFGEVPEAGVVVAGFLDDFLPPGTVVSGALRVLGAPSALDRVAATTRASELIVVPNAVAWETFQELLRRAAAAQERIKIRIAPGAFDVLGGGIRVGQRAYVPLLVLERARIRGVYAFLKRAMDLGVAGIAACVLLVPGTLLAAALAARGSVLTRERVLGAGGRPFTLLRFGARGPGWLRRWLRSPLLRRAPELLHVLAGQMSLVGPRPIPTRDAVAYRGWAPALGAVKPGIIGPWRAVGRRPRTLEDEMRLSLHYVRTHSIWLDLNILAQVALQVVTLQPLAEATAPGVLDDVHDLSLS